MPSMTSRNTQKTHKEIWKFTCKLSVRDTCLFCYKGKSIHFPLIFYILSDCCYYYCCCSGRRKYNHNKCTMCVVCTVIGIVSEFVFFILWSRASGVISDMVSLCELNEKSKVRKTHRLNGPVHTTWMSSSTALCACNLHIIRIYNFNSIQMPQCIFVGEFCA